MQRYAESPCRSAHPFLFTPSQGYAIASLAQLYFHNYKGLKLYMSLRDVFFEGEFFDLDIMNLRLRGKTITAGWLKDLCAMRNSEVVTVNERQVQ